MITVLLCRCNGAEPIAKRTLKSAHYQKWLTVPTYRGKQECLDYLSTLPETLETGSLANFIRGASSWSVILGEKEGKFCWANVGDGQLKSRLDGEMIIEQYGGQ